MTKNTLLAIAAFAAAIANTAKELAGDAGETTPESPATPPAEPATTKRRGRPANTETPAPAEPEKEKPAAPAEGKTEAELREIATPLIQDGRGEEVKKLVVKYGGTKFADLPAANHTAFIRDIEALKM